MPHTSLAQRQQLLAQFHASNLTQAAFARQNHLNANTLHGWIRKEKTLPPSLSFLEVTHTTDPEPAHPCTLQIRSLTLHLPHLPDPTWLATLAQQLP